MAKKIFAIVVMLLAGFTAVLAQTHSTPEMRARAKERSDYSLFRRQIGALKEFADEKKKIPALQKEAKEPVKVYATVDSTETDDSTHAKFLTGFITQQVGETANNAYEVTFDRATRKIIKVKRTGEAIEPEAAEEKPNAKPAADTKKADGAKKATPAKKKKDSDEDDEEEEEKDEKPTKEKDE